MLRIRPAKAGRGALRAPVPVGLEVDLDVYEEGDLDRDLQAEFTLADEVTDDLAECAGGGR